MRRLLKDQALLRAVRRSFRKHGLSDDLEPLTGRPVPAATLAEQLRRIGLSLRIIDEVSSEARLGRRDREFVAWLIDAALDDVER